MLMISLIVCFLIIYWYYQRIRRMTVLERNGISGPKPHFIFGSLKQYNKIGYNECFNQWQKKYGRIFGYYLGAKPFIVVTDPNLLKLIQIKDFHHFSQRPYIIPGGIYRNWKYHQMVTRVDSLRWKTMRTIMSAWFSSSQLKSMVPILNACVEEAMQKLDKTAENCNEFNIYELLEGLTMDSIDRCAFSVQTDIQKNIHNPLIDATRGVFAVKPSEFLASLLLCFPEFSWIINIVRDISETIYDYFNLTSHGLLLKAGKVIVENRLKENHNQSIHKDMLQLMIDVRDNKHNTKSGLNNDTRKTLTDIEIIANTIVIHEAAYESPANNLAFVIHNLINNPEVQDKLIEEIDNLFNSEGEFNYNTIAKLPLTEAVIYETFRLFPTDTLFTSRAPNVDYKYGSIVIPKGVDIRIPTFQLHRDNQFWSQPHIFNPNRFLDSQNKKLIDSVYFQPFGVGPRICPGKRFGILEIKLILANILLKYRLVAGVNTEIGDILLDFKLITLSPKNGIFVKVVPRNVL